MIDFEEWCNLTILFLLIAYRPKSTDDEDFYYTDLDDEEAIVLQTSNVSPPLPPTLSHSDMARPPHEDPEYQRKIVGNMRQGLLMSTNNGQTFVKVPMSSPMVLPTNSNYTWSPLPSQQVWWKYLNFDSKKFTFCWRSHLELATQGNATVQRVWHRSIHLANILHSQLSSPGPTISFDAIARIHCIQVISQLAPAAAPTTTAELTAPLVAEAQCGREDPTEHLIARSPNPRREQEMPKSLRDG